MQILIKVIKVILLVDRLYAEAIEEVKLRAVLSASSSSLIWILGKLLQRPGFETAPNL
jgi:hypothetical protein